jgi:hypothetical protein
MNPHRHRANAMHPRNAIPFAGRGHYRPEPRRVPRHRLHLINALTAIALGAASGVGLFLALSKGV